jgi:hypothetical protein
MIRPESMRALGLAGAALFGLACVGSVGGNGGAGAPEPGESMKPPKPGDRPPPPPDDPPPPPVTAKDSAGLLPVRRLTLNEYNNTVRDLLGTDVQSIGASTALSADVEAFNHGFLKGATVGSANDARQFSKMADDIAAAAVPRLATLAPQGCAAPAAGAEEGCAKKFISEFGLRAFRRPLAADEQADLLALYTKVRGADVGLTYAEGIRTLISGMLQSPMFTYRWELGVEPTKGDGGLVRLNHYEMASRISYAVLASMPDADLFAAAAAGELNNSTAIANQTRRLLATDKAKVGLGEFIVQWLNVSSLPTLSKDESFTNYSAAVGAAMLKESGAFFASIMQGQDSKLERLYTSNDSFVDGQLAKLYGVTNVTGNDMRPVSLSATQRAGILTHGSFLAGHSDGDEPHPIHRGLQVLDKVLCTPIIPPPDFVPPPVKDVAPGIQNRKRFEESTMTEASCSACHTKINAVGFAFENYDAVGAWRDTDANMPVNAAGSFAFGSGEVSFKNAVDFSKALATSKEARDCFTKQFLEYTLRRPVLDSEEASVKAISEAFAASGYDLKELLLATTKTRAFTHRQPAAGEGQQ